MRGSGERTTTAVSFATKAKAPGAAGGAVSGVSTQGTVCTRHIFPCPSNRFTPADMPSVVAPSTLGRNPGGTQTALQRAVALCDEQVGQLWRSTMRGTSRRQPSEQCRATFCQGRLLEMARTTQQPWQGTSHWIRSRCTSTAKVPLQQSMGQSAKLWEPEASEHTSGTGFWFPTTRSGWSRSRVMRQRATWRLGELPTCSKRETTLLTPSQKKGPTLTSQLLESPRQSFACASLAKQAARWAAEAHVLRRYRGWNDTRAAAPRSRVRPP